MLKSKSWRKQTCFKIQFYIGIQLRWNVFVTLGYSDHSQRALLYNIIHCFAFFSMILGNIWVTFFWYISLDWMGVGVGGVRVNSFGQPDLIFPVFLFITMRIPIAKAFSFLLSGRKLLIPHDSPLFAKKSKEKTSWRMASLSNTWVFAFCQSRYS